MAAIEDGDAVGQGFHFRKRMRCEENRGGAGPKNLRLDEMAELRGGDDVDAARGFVEQKDARLMDERTRQAEALHSAGRKRADLAVEKFAERELLSKSGGAFTRGRAREMVELSEEKKVFAGSEARIETVIGASVIAELTSHVAGVADDIMPGDACAAVSGEQERGDNSEQGRFAGPIGAKERDGFAFADFESNVGESRQRGLFEGLEKSAPAAAGGRKGFTEGFDGYGCAIHHATYNVSDVFKTNAVGDLSEGP